MKVLLTLKENFRKIEIKFFSVVRYFTWKLELVSNILWAIVDSNLFSDKVSHKTKHLCKVSFSSYIWFLSYLKLTFWWCLYTTCRRRRLNEPLFTFFCCNNKYRIISLDSCFFRKSWKMFLTNIMMHNRQRCNEKQKNV